jgi:hypothetical protein
MQLVIQAFIKQIKNKELLLQLFTSGRESVKDPLMKLGSTILLSILEEILANTASGAALSYELIESLELKLQIVKIWTSIHLDLVKRFKKLKFMKGLK